MTGVSMDERRAEGPWRHGSVAANGIRFHYVEAGEGSLVLLLHGFPEFWYSWRYQIPALATRFRVVAPDLRGYNETEKPERGYDMRTLTDDVAALVEALGERSCRLAGHDWGGVVAWAAAARFPETIERLAIFNAPHPTLFARAFRSNFSQIRRSWYVFMFQVPGLAEWWLRRDNYVAVVKALKKSFVHREHLTDEDVERFREAMARPGAVGAALAYYRQAFRAALRDGFAARDVFVRVPTLVVWGMQDFALGPELNDGIERWVPDVRVVPVEDAGHWVQQDRPGLASELLLDFFAPDRAG